MESFPTPANDDGGGSQNDSQVSNDGSLNLHRMMDSPIQMRVSRIWA